MSLLLNFKEIKPIFTLPGKKVVSITVRVENYWPNTMIPCNLDSIHILGLLATTASLQQVPELRKNRLPQLQHEHLQGFVS